MYLKIFELIFVLTGILFVLSIVFYKLFVHKIRDNMKKSQYVALMGIFLTVYVIAAVVLFVLIPLPAVKILMGFFAFSPFIIGKFASYKYETLFSMIQAVCIMVSIVYVFCAKGV